jgi:hypothetical protein
LKVSTGGSWKARTFMRSAFFSLRQPATQSEPFSVLHTRSSEAVEDAVMISAAIAS